MPDILPEFGDCFLYFLGVLFIGMRLDKSKQFLLGTERTGSMKKVFVL
jgi:hypothetical protein